MITTKRLRLKVIKKIISIIYYKNFYLSLIVILLFPVLNIYCNNVRILITSNQDEVYFNNDFSLMGNSQLLKKINNEKINLSELKKEYPQCTSFEFYNVNGTFKIGSYQYKGDLRIVYNNKIQLINIIPMEDYILDLLPNEISPEWPLEVIKAQVVAARTFALYEMKNKTNKDYDLTDDTFSQVYKGIIIVHTNFIKALESTKNEIMVYNNMPIQAFFHSTCGGHTEDSQNVWGKSQPYLKAIPCNYCRSSIHYQWEAKFTEEEILEKLKNYNLGKIIAIRPVRISSAGRWITVKIIGMNTDAIINGNTFRILLGIEKLKSTKFMISKQGKFFYIKGKGWGHGVGLCQWGAKAMAEKGYKYHQILRYYYRGIRIRKY